MGNTGNLVAYCRRGVMTPDSGLGFSEAPIAQTPAGGTLT
jgi:hypothetical protein